MTTNLETLLNSLPEVSYRHNDNLYISKQIPFYDIGLKNGEIYKIAKKN